MSKETPSSAYWLGATVIAVTGAWVKATPRDLAAVGFVTTLFWIAATNRASTAHLADAIQRVSELCDRWETEGDQVSITSVRLALETP